jgi:hypothetical protein
VGEEGGLKLQWGGFRKGQQGARAMQIRSLRGGIGSEVE